MKIPENLTRVLVRYKTGTVGFALYKDGMYLPDGSRDQWIHPDQIRDWVDCFTINRWMDQAAQETAAKTAVNIAIDIAQKNAVDKIRVAFESAMKHYKGELEKEIRAHFEEGLNELNNPEPKANQLIRKEFDKLVAALSANHSLLSSIEIKSPNKKDDR